MTLMMDRGLVVSRATAAVLTGVAVPIFTVAWGRVLVLDLVGQITTVIESTTVNFRFIANPTTGTTTNLSADLDIDADEAGGLLTIAGAAATATQRGLSGSVPSTLTDGVVVKPGTIEAISDVAATGSLSFMVRYIPLDEGAVITAA